MITGSHNSSKHIFYSGSSPRILARVFLISIYLITATLTACKSTDGGWFIDRSFLTDKPCAAPCWYGLKLNVSSKDDVMNTLQQLSFVDQNSIQKVEGWTEDQNLEELEFACSYSKPKTCGRIVFREGKVWRMIISIGYQLTLAETVQKLGPPSAVFLIPTVETVGCTVILSWPENKIQVDGVTSLNCSNYNTKNGVKVDSGIKVETISYRSDLTQDMIKKEGYEPWQGFLKP